MPSPMATAARGTVHPSQVVKGYHSAQRPSLEGAFMTLVM